MADYSHDSSHGHPENPIKYYICVFVLLMIMTGLTVFVAKFDLAEKFKHTWGLEHISGVLNAIVALTIAVIKATAVVLIFMHVRWSSGVRDRFGSHLRFYKFPGQRTRLGSFPIIATESKSTSKAVPNARTPKASPIR